MKRHWLWPAWVGAIVMGTITVAGVTLPSRAAERVAAEPRMTTPSETEVVLSVPGERLAGTLTRPVGDLAEPRPAVLLLSGAGTQDRDGTFSGDHRPLALLARSFAEAGWVVLRLDDRGARGHAPDAVHNATTLATRIADAGAAIAMLRSLPDVDRQRVGVLGHSEGATVAAAVSVKHEAAFVVSLAGPALSGRDLGPLQVAKVLRATADYPASTVNALVEAQRDLVSRVAEGADVAVIEASILRGLRVLNGLQPVDHQRDDHALVAQARRDVATVASPWFRTYVKTDPTAFWREVSCPVLALNGSRDLLVDPTHNVPALSAALAGRSRAEIHVLPGLNHMLQPAVRGTVDEYATSQVTIADDAVRRVLAFAGRAVSAVE